MSPIKEKHPKKSYRLWIIYLIIFIICIFGIASAVYFQFNQVEHIQTVSEEDEKKSEEEDRYNYLKAEFPALFTNNVERVKTTSTQVEKINNNFDIVATAYKYEKLEENYKLNVYIPQINVKKDIPIEINKSIRDKFKNKVEEIEKLNNSEYTIYSVTYKAYLQQDILSLVIRSEFKEGSNGQIIQIETYNYNIAEDKEVTLEDLLAQKGLKVSEVENKVQNEIKKTQEQNEALIGVLSNQNVVFKRDYKSEIYKVENTDQYFLGKDGMLYLVYAYGNTEDTSENDVVIFK